MSSRDRGTFEELIKIQNNMNSKVLQEMEEDKEIDLISLINEQTYEDIPTQIEKIIIEAQNIGYSEDAVLDVIERMKHQNIIYQPSLGYIQKLK